MRKMKKIAKTVKNSFTINFFYLIVKILIMDDYYFQIENIDYDIPFYNGNPKLSSSQLAVLILAPVLVFAISFFDASQFLKAILFFAIPTASVCYALKGNMSLIFRMPERKDILYILASLIIFFILLSIVNIILRAFAVPMPRHAPLDSSPVIMIISLFIQLVGEELYKFILLVLPMIFLYRRIGRRASIIAGIIFSQFVFSISHAHAYAFNIPYILLVIGIPSTVFPLLYLKTKNITVTYISHLIWDFIGLIGMAVTAGMLIIM